MNDWQNDRRAAWNASFVPWWERLGRPVRRIRRGAEVPVLDWDEDDILLELVWIFKGE